MANATTWRISSGEAPACRVPRRVFDPDGAFGHRSDGDPELDKALGPVVERSSVLGRLAEGVE